MELVISDDAEMLAKIEIQLRQFLLGAEPDRHRAFFEGVSIRPADISRFIADSGDQFGDAIRNHSDDIQDMPKIVHRLWLTSIESGHMPPLDYLKQIARQARSIGADYSCIFWSNSNDIILKLEAFFTESDADITVRNISNAFEHSPLMPIVESLVDSRKYVVASDVAKFMILLRFGGVYADLGIQFQRALLQLIQHSDTALFLDAGMFFQPAFIAFKAKSEMVRLWCEVLKTPEALSAVVFGKVDRFSAGQEVWLHGGIGFTAVFLLFQPPGARVLVLPPQGIALHTHSQGSWYNDGNKFGNVILKEATVTRIDMDRHRARVIALEKSGAPGLSDANGARSKILAGLPEYFWLD